VTSSTNPGHETVASTDGVEVAVHHLVAGPTDSPLLISHATGFHARAYRPMAEELADRFDDWGHDSRGHGSTAVSATWTVDWRGYGDDALAVAEWLAERSGTDGELVGFGHSMGGATLLMAELRRPGLFRALVLYEPIVFPPIDGATDVEPGESPLAQGARRRRSEFPSYQEAIENYRSKPPMNAFDSRALDEYVYGGFRPVDFAEPRGAVELTCAPAHEAATFAGSHASGLWPHVPSITTPTLVIGGHPADTNPPSLLAEPVAEMLPNGTYLETPLDHFGPFVDPAAVAGMVREFTA
jgi:pimeloyl-ACP methyl ester carboxylesterase